MAIDHRMVHFRTDDLSEVVGELDAIAERSNGREWITISPWVDPENLPVVSMLHRIFSARASKVPEATWVPAIDGEPAQLGVLHASGAQALNRLIESEAAIPEKWINVSDHSKRGLLFAVHPEATPIEVITFAIAASAVLAMVPTDDRWIAQVSTLAS